MSAWNPWTNPRGTPPKDVSEACSDTDFVLARAVSTRIAQALSGRGNITIGEIDRMIIDLIEAEREACAKIADGMINIYPASDERAIKSTAAAIRARGNKDTP